MVFARGLVCEFLLIIERKKLVHIHMFVIVADLLGDNGFVWQCLLGQFFCFLTQKKKKGSTQYTKVLLHLCHVTTKKQKTRSKKF
jgi:hypothetical protein